MLRRPWAFLGGSKVIFEVKPDDMSLLRYDGAAMDEPVLADEEDRDRMWSQAAKDHPEWVNGGMISIPREAWRYSWQGVGSVWYDGTISYRNLKYLSF